MTAVGVRQQVQGEAEVGAEGEAAALKRQRSIAKALQLTPVQCQTLAWIRERQLKKVAVLANARRELNMQVWQQLILQFMTLIRNHLQAWTHSSFAQIGCILYQPHATHASRS